MRAWISRSLLFAAIMLVLAPVPSAFADMIRIDFYGPTIGTFENLPGLTGAEAFRGFFTYDLGVADVDLDPQRGIYPQLGPSEFYFAIGDYEVTSRTFDMRMLSGSTGPLFNDCLCLAGSASTNLPGDLATAQISWQTEGLRLPTDGLLVDRPSVLGGTELDIVFGDGNARLSTNVRKDRIVFSTVPEPSSLMVLVAGFLTVFALRPFRAARLLQKATLKGRGRL